MSLSICIPTFNRCKHLKKLLNSIFIQDRSNIFFANLEIVIVDDGSQDETKEVVNHFAIRKEVKIIYKFQNNQGRAFALHKCIKLASNSYIMFMDDDDYFFKNSFKYFDNINIKRVSSNKKIAGFFFLRKTKKYSNKLINIMNYFEEDLVSFRRKFKINYEFAEITKSEILKKNIYPLFKNEKRIPTGVIWYKISEKYKYLFINEFLAYRNHLNDGLSKNIRHQKIQSPKSSFYFEYLVFKSSKNGMFNKIRSLVFMSRYKFHFVKIEFVDISKNLKILLFIFSIIGFVIYIFDKLIYKNLYK